MKRDFELTCGPRGEVLCDIQDDDALRVLVQTALSRQCRASAHPGPGGLAAEAELLATEIGELTSAWNAAPEVDTNLGADVETAGRSLVLLCDQAAAALGTTDPDLAAQARQLSASLGEAVTYYQDLEEHEFDASIDIFDRLGPGITLILHALQRADRRTAPAPGTPAAGTAAQASAAPENTRPASEHATPSRADKSAAAVPAAGRDRQ